MPPRVLAMTAATLAVIISFLGCGSTEPQFDPATKYSPASLAREFSFRYKSLDRSKPESDKPDGVVIKGGAVTKTGAATKAARPDTFAALLQDVIEKASKIPGMTQSQACKEVAEEVAKDPTFTDADKKTVAEKLGQVND